MKCAILATGPSMSQAVADSVRDYPVVVVVNNAYQLAPWAHALAAQDHAWWNLHTDALQFKGRKFSANKIEGVEQVFSDFVKRPSSSGVLALEITRRLCSGNHDVEIELHGFNNSGTHYFGTHPEPLQNTSSERFGVFEQQIADLGGEMVKAGIRIVNKTPNSALRCFPWTQ